MTGSFVSLRIRGGLRILETVLFNAQLEYLMVHSRLILATVAFTIALHAAPAKAGTGGLDLRPVVAVGGGVGTRFGGTVGARLRWLPETPLALEASLFVPYGGGCNLLIDVFRNDRVRVHLFDPGIFWAFSPDLRVVGPKFARPFDITAGGGVEVRVWDRWVVTADWRWFFPEPFGVITTYGNFAQPMYEKALVGGQIWIGVSYSLISPENGP